MVKAQQDETEQEVRDLLAEGEVDQAVEVVLAGYGARVFRMMMGVLHDESKAQDVYQDFSVQLWGSLDSFRGESKVYTWIYTIARRSISKALRGENREVRLDTARRQKLRDWTRTATAEWRKTDARSKFQQMLEDLKPDNGKNRLHVSLLGDDAAVAGVLRKLVAADVPVLHFTEETRDLESVFMRATRGIVS